MISQQFKHARIDRGYFQQGSSDDVDLAYSVAVGYTSAFLIQLFQIQHIYYPLYTLISLYLKRFALLVGSTQPNVYVCVYMLTHLEGHAFQSY